MRRGKVLIGQSYLSASDQRARGFVLGSYLLIKGSHTFLNMDIGSEAQWFPEYGVALDGAADTRGWGLRLIRVGGSISLPAHSGLVLLDG